MLCCCSEYDELPVRHNEDKLNAELSKEVRGLALGAGHGGWGWAGGRGAGREPECFMRPGFCWETRIVWCTGVCPGGWHKGGVAAVVEPASVM